MLSNVKNSRVRRVVIMGYGEWQITAMMEFYIYIYIYIYFVKMGRFGHKLNCRKNTHTTG
jgi:hypothetical protein